MLPLQRPPKLRRAWVAARRFGARRADVWDALGCVPLHAAHQHPTRRAAFTRRPVARASGPNELATAPDVSAVSLDDRTVAVNVDGYSHTFTVPTPSERWAPAGDSGGGQAGAIVAPFPGAVTEVAVEPGRQVARGDAVVVLEAMKMLHTLTAAGPGVVAEVRVAAGDQVVSQQVLVTFAPDTDDPPTDDATT